MSGPFAGRKGSKLTVSIVALGGDITLLIHDYMLWGSCCPGYTYTLVVMPVGVGS